MDRLTAHQAQCELLAAQIKAARAARQRVTLRKPTSNLFRRRSREGKRYLDVRRLGGVLRVDPERRRAGVQGMTTYEDLVDETLKHGLLPAVVPQLKTITVGGAVSGLGVESSSFKFGLVHESVEEMDVLTGEGTIVSCSPCRNQDLFFGFPNSYGSLGYALRLSVRLIPAKPYVHLRHTRFSDAGRYFARIAELCDEPGADYLDGTIFSRDEMYLTEGAFSDRAPRVSDYTYMNIYYQSIRRKAEDWLTSKGYIWRWDTDWFWCSKQFYVQHAALRWLAGPALNSRSYQRIMRLGQRLLPDSGRAESVIQDVDIPVGKAECFFDFLHSEIGITPIWMCPFRNSDRRWDLHPLEPSGLFINFGFWDVIPAGPEPGYFNRKIEDKAMELGGAKGLYSSAWYDQETFWRIYDRERYLALKTKYDPDHVFEDMYAKCVGRK
jgi:FAD/FMN-containing dehydrogenase